MAKWMGMDEEQLTASHGQVFPKARGDKDEFDNIALDLLIASLGGVDAQVSAWLTPDSEPDTQQE